MQKEFHFYWLEPRPPHLKKYRFFTPKPYRLLKEPGAPPDLWIEWKGRGQTNKIHFYQGWLSTPFLNKE